MRYVTKDKWYGPIEAFHAKVRGPACKRLKT
jgi:hypothetical protein